MTHFLGIDLGTSYFKVGLFDEAGRLKGLGRQFVRKTTDGIVCELPVDVFWKTIRDCVDEAIQMAAIQTNTIKSVSYSTQVNSFILLDEHDHPLTPLILWPDKRASGMALPAVDAAQLMKRTGLGRLPGDLFAVAKLNWFQQHRPACWHNAACILSISDFLTFSLTGKKASDYSTASMSGLFDLTDNTWWAEQLERFGIRPSMLPSLQRTGVYVGATSANAVGLAGLPQGISYSLGGLDHHIAAIGAGIPTNRHVCESTGTVLSCVDYAERFEPQQGVCVAPGLHAGHFFRMAYDENGASSLEWYQKNYAPDYSIQELLGMAETVAPGCEGLTARPCAGTFPGLSGFFVASPADFGQHPSNDWSSNRHLKSAEPVCHHHGHYVRALLESTARSLRQLVSTLKKDSPLPAIVSSGGGSRSALWSKIKSETVKTSFLTPECTELACMGAAMMGALGIHSFGSYDEIVNEWVRTTNNQQ